MSHIFPIEFSHAKSACCSRLCATHCTSCFCVHVMQSSAAAVYVAACLVLGIILTSHPCVNDSACAYRSAAASCTGGELKHCCTCGCLAILQVDNSGCPDPQMEVTLGIGYLKSYEHMGQASVSCVSGCMCKQTLFDGHNPASTASQEFWAYVPVTQSEQCVFKVQSLGETKSGQNKVKVTSLLLTCMSPEKAPFTT